MTIRTTEVLKVAEVPEVAELLAVAAVLEIVEAPGSAEDGRYHGIAVLQPLGRSGQLGE